MRMQSREYKKIKARCEHLEKINQYQSIFRAKAQSVVLGAVQRTQANVVTESACACSYY